MRHSRKAILDLLLASALGLFIELVLIRWVASEMRLFAFYKNFALIAAFLGLGLGFALYARRKSRGLFDRAFMPMLLFTVVVVLILGRAGNTGNVLVNQAGAQEFFWAGYIGDASEARLLQVALYLILLLVFTLLTLLFIPLGTLVAEKFQGFRPLQGYTINILGSLAGILIFILMSFLRWPPSTWFLLIGISVIYFLPRKPAKSLLRNSAMVAFPIALTLIQPIDSDRTLWSPYYRIDINPVYSKADPSLLLGHDISVNQAWHQRIWNLDPSFVQAHSDIEKTHFESRYPEYDAPYETSANLDNVLIVGAGSGNDVAGALRAGAKHVTAVEIDPLIVDIGREMHPETPYQATERVDVVIEDARSFFRRADGPYDLIVFGLLDSHTLFSSASSVRLDNFVYTTESLSEVRELLSDDGMLVLSFGVPRENEWVGLRLYRILTDVFGHSPQAYQSVDGNIILVTRLNPLADPLFEDPRMVPRQDYTYRADIEATTDQWPYLYLRERTIPTAYLISLAGVILVSLVIVRRVLPDFRGLNLHFFFLGAAFFLLETKSVTEIALLLGSTWLVNAVVISAILIMIVAANLLVARLRLSNPRPYYGMLMGALLFNYLVPISSFLELPLVWRITVASLAQALPLFFAGIIFAILFRKTKSIEIALGSNLMGAVLGGIFEYASLAWGIQSLYLLAMVFYLLSAIALLRFESRRSEVVPI